jgi:hypothetical protein
MVEKKLLEVVECASLTKVDPTNSWEPNWIEWIFNVASFSTSLQRCQLGWENLDSLVIIYKKFAKVMF